MSYAVHSKFVEGANSNELLKKGLGLVGLSSEDKIVVVTPKDDSAESFDIDVTTVAKALNK